MLNLYSILIRRISLIICMAFVFPLLSCSTVRTAEERGGETVATRTIVPIVGTRIGKGGGGILMVTSFENAKMAGLGKSPCRLRLLHKASGKDTFVTIQPNEQASFTRLEPGTYTMGRLGCGLTKVWDLENILPGGFVVEAGSVSYIGKLIFEFEGKELTKVRKAPRVESAEAFMAAERQVPDEAFDLISGYTGRRIDRSMVDSGDLREGFNVLATGKENMSSHLDPLLKTLTDCANTEAPKDPMRFGRLEYTAVYKKGRFSEMKNREEKNAFSDDLRGCVERGLMSFQPRAKADFEIRVKY